MIQVTRQNQSTTKTEEATLIVEETSVLPWLTGEVALYLLLACLAFSVRLANLGDYPLTSVEAAQALVSLEVFQGRIPAEATDYSPLMVSLNSLAFFIFGSSDVAARLGSVLLGLILVLLPLGLRQQLGLVGALVASGLFAFSASSLYWSRVNTGEIAVAVGALMLFVGGVRWLEAETNEGLFLLVTGFVFLLISASSGFTILALLLAFCLFVVLTNREAFADLQSRLAGGEFTLRQAGILGGSLLILLGTAALFNLTGLAAISDLFSEWLGQFGLTLQPEGGYPAILMLLFYEPVVVLFGIAGIALSVVERRTLDQILVIWFGSVILLDLLMGGRSSGQVLLALAPMILLASRAISRLLVELSAKAHLEAEGLFIGFGLILSVFAYISLTSWSKCPSDQPGCNTTWVLPVAGVALILALFLIFWRWYGAATAWRGIGTLLLITIGLFSVGASWRLNHALLKDLPYQPMVSQSVSTQFLALLGDVTRLSIERTSDPYDVDLALINLDQPILRWYLRDFTEIRFAGNFAAASGADIILAPSEAGQPVGGGYVGQDLALTSHWRPSLIEGKAWIRWYLFRFLPHHQPETERVILWVREPTL